LTLPFLATGFLATSSSESSSDSSSLLSFFAYLAGTAFLAGWATLAAVLGKTLTSSSELSSESSLLSALAGAFFAGAATGFFKTAVFPFGFSSSDSSLSSESSLDTAFLLMTAFCPFLACLSVPAAFLFPVLDSEVVLGLLSPTRALAA